MNDFEDKFGKNFIDLFKTLTTKLKEDLGYVVDFPPNAQWVNTNEELTIEKLKGHIVLLDFWTYCCINCIHVLDDLKYLEEKYKKEPFIVIGVHSPKFQNEKDIDNVKSAIARYGIKHPVLIDNELYLWNQYNVNAWPSFVLIDAEGKIISKKAGEGNRFLLDNSIEDALEEGRKKGTLASKPIEITSDIVLDSILRFPGKIDIDFETNNLYISDSNHDRILKVFLEEDNTGNVISIIGGKTGFKDGNFEQAQFNKPQGIIFNDKTLYVADTENHAIRRIDFNKQYVETIAGTGKQGNKREYKGDPLKISLNSPWDLAIDDKILFIAMAGTHQIWKMDLENNIIENFAGSGNENIIDADIKKAALAQPSGLSYDSIRKRLYFTDSEVSALRYIDLEKKNVKSLIGKGLFVFGLNNGKFKNALLQHPIGLDVNKEKIYIADTYNHAIRVANIKTAEIENLIYRPKKGICKIGDEDCNVLPLFEPNDVLYYKEKLYITDTNNHLIRVFDFGEKTLSDLYLLE
ncbi:MAG: redoxin family protein [Candidatus Lokiarchaeota archaeon]